MTEGARKRNDSRQIVSWLTVFGLQARGNSIRALN
jgi:hypothetical protein